MMNSFDSFVVILSSQKYQICTHLGDVARILEHLQGIWTASDKTLCHTTPVMQ